MSRIRWFHLYLVLAALDVLIIAAGLWMHHRTLDSFNGLLVQSARLDARERELTALGQAVLHINAPGNRVFETRRVADELDDFRCMVQEIGRLKTRLTLPADRMAGFWNEVAEMCRAEEAVFAALAPPEPGADAPPASSVDAAAMEHMARMDARQAGALRMLADEHEATLSEAAEVHMQHQRFLDGQARVELALAAALVVVLIGIAAYTRKLLRTEEAVQAARRRAEDERRERLAVIGELCTGVAHGIQNPLAAIHSSAELIVDLGRLDEPSRRRARDVLTTCSQLSRRVTRLLEFARGVGGVREPLDVAAVVAGVAAEIRPRLAERDVRLTQSDDGADATVLGDADELASVVLELLSNAADHTPAGGEIRVSRRSTEDAVIVEVSDAGPGVPPAAADRVFDLFYTTRQNGTGVGLAWARRVVQSLGGTLVVDKDRRPGATFRVTLPRACASADRPVRPRRHAADAVPQFAAGDR